MEPRMREQVPTSSGRTSNDDGDVCWICLDGERPGDPLVSPCQCPRLAHKKCIARWQLQSAGRGEEKTCRFCHTNLPDWRHVLTPDGLTPSRSAVMAVVFNDKVHLITVESGPDGLEKFEREIRRIFCVSDDDTLNFTFDCRAPGSGDPVKLQGSGAFNAAVHCATVFAAARQNSAKSLGDGTEPRGERTSKKNFKFGKLFRAASGFFKGGSWSRSNSRSGSPAPSMPGAAQQQQQQQQLQQQVVLPQQQQQPAAAGPAGIEGTPPAAAAQQ